jgi:lysophospholipase L1-like esterase
MQWVEATDLDVEGRGFADAASPYDRLPARARGRVPDAVWAQAEYSSGLVVRFATDAACLRVRWRLRFDQRVRPAPGLAGFRRCHHQWLVDCAVGTHQSGLDLYRRHAGGWLWVQSLTPVGFPDAEARVTLPPAAAGERVDYLLYLPLFNGVDHVRLAVPPGAALAAAPPRPAARRRPICLYGTSVLHGATALRPGMAMPAIVGRRLDRPVLNLGFCGSALAELEVAQLLAEIDAAVFVVDPVPNMSAEEVSERIGPFVRTLRAAHPQTPIVLGQGNVFDPAGRDAAVPAWSHYTAQNRALTQAVDGLVREGMRHVHLLDGVNLFGPDGEGTHDGVHPTELGMQHMAERFVLALRPLLGDEAQVAREQERERV